MTVNLDATSEETELIQRIAERTRDLHLKYGSRADTLSIILDVTATHVNGCKLDLQQLLEFSEFDLLHDVSGIAKHLDRGTGKLQDFFLPRCAIALPKYVTI